MFIKKPQIYQCEFCDPRGHLNNLYNHNKPKKRKKKKELFEAYYEAFNVNSKSSLSPSKKRTTLNSRVAEQVWIPDFELLTSKTWTSEPPSGVEKVEEKVGEILASNQGSDQVADINKHPDDKQLENNDFNEQRQQLPEWDEIQEKFSILDSKLKKISKIHGLFIKDIEEKEISECGNFEISDIENIITEKSLVSYSTFSLQDSTWSNLPSSFKQIVYMLEQWKLTYQKFFNFDDNLST